jgi:hypothetical protein
MDELARAARSARGKIPLFNQAHPKAPQRRIQCDTVAGHTATDHQNVDALAQSSQSVSSKG